MEIEARDASAILRYMRQSHDDGGLIRTADIGLIQSLIEASADPESERADMRYYIRSVLNYGRG